LDQRSSSLVARQRQSRDRSPSPISRVSPSSRSNSTSSRVAPPGPRAPPDDPPPDEPPPTGTEPPPPKATPPPSPDATAAAAAVTPAVAARTIERCELGTNWMSPASGAGGTQPMDPSLSPCTTVKTSASLKGPPLALVPLTITWCTPMAKFFGSEAETSKLPSGCTVVEPTCVGVECTTTVTSVLGSRP